MSDRYWINKAIEWLYAPSPLYVMLARKHGKSAMLVAMNEISRRRPLTPEDRAVHTAMRFGSPDVDERRMGCAQYNGDHRE